MANAESAYIQMKAVYEQFAKDHYNSPKPLKGNGTVKAIHYIQSFDPKSEITPELAHKITKEFVLKTFGKDAQFVIATHVDKQHIHSHIILNSYSLSGKKFYANKASLKRVRECSDRVCKEYGIEPSPAFTGKGRSMQYNEWQHLKDGTSWKERIRQEIDKHIPNVRSLDELFQVLEERGYEIKCNKYISIRAPDRERFVRTKTLGEEYTEESLKARLLYKDVGKGIDHISNIHSEIRDTYQAAVREVRILAEYRKKVPRKRIVTSEYSVDNDLDVYKLSAQLSVINRDNISSIGEVDGMIKQAAEKYEKLRQETNNDIDRYNALGNVIKQAREYFDINSKAEKTESDIMKLTVYKHTLEKNGINTKHDLDMMISDEKHLDKKITANKMILDDCKRKYDIYNEIKATYNEISKGDYISRLVEEERERQSKLNKKKTKSR